MLIRKELLDELMKDYQCPEDLLGEAGRLNQLKKALLEPAFAAEAVVAGGGVEEDDTAGVGVILQTAAEDRLRELAAIGVARGVGRGAGDGGRAEGERHA